MTFKALKLGAEPKKIVILGGLVSVLGGVWYSTREPETPAAPTNRPAATASPVPGGTRTAPRAQANRAPGLPRVGQRGGSVQEFKVSMKPKDQSIDPTQYDPTLKLGLLAKLQTVKIEGGMRSLFDFGAAPAPPKPPKVDPIKIAEAPKTDPIKTEPPKPPPPAIPLKFYGFVNVARGGTKSAFFLDGDEIFVASEGDTVKNRYKIKRIGVNSAVVEDIQYKNEQTIRLVDEAPVSG
jgi:hypothetical protein